MSAAILLPHMAKSQQIPVPPRRQQPAASHTAERIVLTGFMGSGKSTVGALLAGQLGWTFTDLDEEIVRRSGMKVSEIFAQLGESHFRRLEASALASVLGHRHAVIALGGGAPEALGNRLLLEQTPATVVVFLHAPFAVLHERCMQQGAAIRPLIANRDAAEARFNMRLRAYDQIATVRVDTTSSTAQATSEQIAALVRKTI